MSYHKTQLSYGIQDRAEAFRPGVGIQCVAPVKYQIQWTGTPEDLIMLGEHLSMEIDGYPMDSHDLGDSMGIFMRYISGPWGEGEFELTTDHGILRATQTPELFQWEGLPDQDDTTCKGVE